MRQPEGVLWLNGPFGSGKSSTARRLVARYEDAVLFDPEVLGAMLRDIVPVPTGDFQDLPQWRELLIETVASLHRHGTSLIVMPMTVLRREYLEELLIGLRSAGAEMWHVLLDASPAELERRIAADTRETERARSWRRRKLADFVEARDSLLPLASAVLSTDAADVQAVADRIAHWLAEVSGGQDSKETIASV